jgi:hypothetical protein
VTLRLFVQPVEPRGTWQVSGTSPQQQRSGVAEAGKDIAPEALVRIQPSPH